MGWGSKPHEGYRARVLKDGSLASQWSAETNQLATGEIVVCCSCGWRGGRYPDDRSDAVDDLTFIEWRDTHMAAMVDPEPGRVLILAEDAGGPRHYLAGHPVHAGTMLELRLAGDLWVPIRYEWTWDKRRPRGYLALGGRGEAVGEEWAPGPVDFELPERAELRWPSRRQR